MPRFFWTVCIALAALPGPSAAWGPDGHSVVGVLALEQVSAQAHLNLKALLGSTQADDIAQACNWPDAYRDRLGGEATAPLHYVNIDPEAGRYKRSRDCPGDACVTEAIRRFAAELADLSLPVKQRREAFAFLCHFTGDLHQPMHVGFAADRGGNDQRIRYRGQNTNLHRFWDSDLLTVYAPVWQELLPELRSRYNQGSPPWSPGDVTGWTNESFTLMRTFGYPEDRDIDEGFESKSWQVAQQQLDVAAERLAAILDALLGN